MLGGEGEGGTASSRAQMKGNSMPFVSGKSRDCYEYIISRLPVEKKVAVGCKESRLWGLIKPNSCWFVLLVEKNEGVKGKGKGVVKGRYKIRKELRKVISSLGPAAHRLWRTH